VLVALANAATSVACGAVVFAILGFMAHKSGVPFEQVGKRSMKICFILAAHFARWWRAALAWLLSSIPL